MAVPDVIRARYLEVNGDHPTTAADEVYCRQHFVPLAGDGTYPLDDVHRMIVDRRLALPSYLLGDGTPMVHPGHLDLLHAAGGRSSSSDGSAATGRRRSSRSPPRSGTPTCRVSTSASTG